MEELSLEDEYIKYVLETIEKYKKYSDRLTRDEFEVFPEDVQNILANYQSVKFGILAELNRRMRVIRTLKRKYNDWWNDKVSIARRELLSTMPSGKFPALKEYSIKAQEDNSKEYNKWQEDLQEAEDKYDFMKMVKADWDSFQWTIGALNDNMKSELKSLCIDRDYNLNSKRIRVKKES